MLQHTSGAEDSETEAEPEETLTQKLLDWWGDPNPKQYNAHTVRGILLFVKHSRRRMHEDSNVVRMTADHCVEHKVEDGKTTYLGCLGHFGDMNTIFAGQYAVCSLTHTDAAHPVRSCALLSARFKDGVWWVVNPDI